MTLIKACLVRDVRDASAFTPLFILRILIIIINKRKLWV